MSRYTIEVNLLRNQKSVHTPTQDTVGRATRVSNVIIRMGQPEKTTFRWVAPLHHGVPDEFLGSESPKTFDFLGFILTKISKHTDQDTFVRATRVSNSIIRM